MRIRIEDVSHSAIADPHHNCLADYFLFRQVDGHLCPGVRDAGHPHRGERLCPLPLLTQGVFRNPIY